MTLIQLRYFYVIAKYENYRRASEILNVSQPSLTKQIKNLEIELGIKLFEKDGRGVKLNKYGLIFFEETKDILERIDISVSNMKKYASNNGTIDMAYVFPLAYKYIPTLIRSYLDEIGNKNTTFNFHQSYTEEMIEGLKKDKYDIIFSSYVENEDDLTFHPILNQEMVIITSIDHPLAQKDKVVIKDLSSYPLIIYDNSTGLGRKTLEIFKKYKINANIIGESPDENSIASLVSEKLGIALVANVDSLKNHNIKINTISDVKIKHTVYLAYVKNRYQSKAVRNFISFVKEKSQLV